MLNFRSGLTKLIKFRFGMHMPILSNFSTAASIVSLCVFRAKLQNHNMQVVILAGGLGTRLSELTSTIPKPMVMIGDQPILYHIMKYYASFGHKDFVIALGYKGFEIKDYFINVNNRNSDLELDFTTGTTKIIAGETLDWKITFVDTGLETQTGGRLLKLNAHLENEFLLTYGDGLSDVDINKVIESHRASDYLATVTAVIPPARFGSLKIIGNKVTAFSEKNPKDESRINGGFFCVSKRILDFIGGTEIAFEREPLMELAKHGLLGAYRHDGFWHSMDTLRDQQSLNTIWQSGDVPWVKP